MKLKSMISYFLIIQIILLKKFAIKSVKVNHAVYGAQINAKRYDLFAILPGLQNFWVTKNNC